MSDISKLLKTSGVNPEKIATDMFGTAVDDFAQGKINPALKSAFGKSGTPTVNRNDGSWYASSYAHSLANSQYRPKLKFLFRVEFLFKPELLAKYNQTSATWKDTMQFMIKSVDRPKVDFEYEDVNQYNFRTKVLKQIKHRELTMTFYDDVGNNVHEFFRFIMMAMSPITRRSATSTGDITSGNTTVGSGMLFSENLGNVNDLAHRGVVNTDIGNVIQAIKITQFYVKPGKTQRDLDEGAKEVTWVFVNPRVVSFDLDDVNHETNDMNLFTMQFDYDYMVLGAEQNLKAVSAAQALPPVGGAPGDVAPTGRGSSSGATSPGGNNKYTSMLTSIGARATSKLTSETLGRVVRSIPGGESISSNLTGLVEGFTRDKLGGIGNAINQSFARPGRDVVVDSSTAGKDTATIVPSPGNDQPSGTG